MKKVIVNADIMAMYKTINCMMLMYSGRIQ